MLAGGLPVGAGGSAPPLSRSSGERGALGTRPRRDHRSCFARESGARPAASSARQAALGALISACSAVRASDASSSSSGQERAGGEHLLFHPRRAEHGSGSQAERRPVCVSRTNASTTSPALKRRAKTCREPRKRASRPSRRPPPSPPNQNLRSSRFRPDYCLSAADASRRLNGTSYLARKLSTAGTQ